MAAKRIPVTGDTSFLDINDLKTVLSDLKQFRKSDWQKFGLEAGLRPKTIDRIAGAKAKDYDSFKECLSCWLRRQDKVDSRGKPSRSRLAEILDNIGEKNLANKIRGRKVPYRVMMKKSFRMSTAFGFILERFVNRVCEKRETLDKLKSKMRYHWSWKKKQIDEVHDEGGLIYLLRSHCSLWNFSILRSLMEEMEMVDIAEELDQFEQQQKKIHREVVEITADETIVFSVQHSLEPYQFLPGNEEEEEENDGEIGEEYNDVQSDQCCSQEARKSSELYACLMFYEKKQFTYFTAAPIKMLSALLKYIKDHHQFAEIGPVHCFHFKRCNGFIELNFNERPSAGWTIIPLTKPCRLYQEDIDMFDGTDEAIPPSCLISVHESPGAVPILRYLIPLEGVANPVSIFIDREILLEEDALELHASHEDTPTKKERKLQKYIQSLRHDLQVAHQSKVSLQEALLEANKQVKGNDFMSSVLEEMRQEKEKLIKEKQIITEDNEELKLEVADIEKLKLKVADNLEFITEILEKKTLLQEEKQIITEINEKLKLKLAHKEEKEEQYLKEMQIIIDNIKILKTDISEKDEVIAKLTSQVEEQSQNEKHIITDLKERDLLIAKLVKERQETVLKQPIESIGLQCNYLIPSMDKFDCLSDDQVAERKLFLIQGDKPQLMNWGNYGLRIGVQEASLSSTDTVEAAVVALVGGQFQFPPNTVLVSAVYAISLSKPLLKPLILEIQHCVNLTGQLALSRHLKFAIAPVSTPSLPYQFTIVEGGEFSSNYSRYGSIRCKELPSGLFAILALGEAQETEPSMAPQTRSKAHFPPTLLKGLSVTVDVTEVKKVINNVLVSHYAALNCLKMSLSDLASKLYAAGLISDEVSKTCSMDKFIDKFEAGLNLKKDLRQVEEHCQKFLNSFIAVRGSYANAAIDLHEDWIEAIWNELGFDFNIKLLI